MDPRKTTKLQHVLVHKPERKIIGRQIRTSNSTPKDFFLAWQEFLSEDLLHKIHNRLSDTIYVVYSDYEGDYQKPFSYLIGCEVPSSFDAPKTIAKGMCSVIIPSKTYVEFSPSGPIPEALAECWQQIWNSDLKRTYTVDFEEHTLDTDPARVKVCIAID